MIPSFRILGDFSPFRLLGLGGIFRRPVIPRFRLLGFGVIFRRSMIPPFRHSAVPSFLLLGSPCFGSIGTRLWRHSPTWPCHFTTVAPRYNEVSRYRKKKFVIAGSSFRYRDTSNYLVKNKNIRYSGVTKLNNGIYTTLNSLQTCA